MSLQGSTLVAPTHVWLSQSCYSFLQGASWPEELVAEAARLGYQGLCLADFDGIYGLVRAWKAAKEYGISLFYGVQIAIEMFPEGTGGGELRYCERPVFLQDRLLFIATSLNSYGELCKLVSFAHRFGKQADPLRWNDSEIPWPNDVIVILPARGVSQLFSPRQSATHETWMERVRYFNSRWSGSFFLALTPPSSPFEQNAFENHLAGHRLAGIPLLASEDVFFHSEERKYLHDIMTAIRANESKEDIQWRCFSNAERSLHSPQRFNSHFVRNRFADAVENNRTLSARISFDFSELRYQYPHEFVPEGETPLSYLALLTAQAIEKRYGRSVPEKIVLLTSKELALIDELGVADYFLTVWDIVEFARKKGILCQGRGSAANSSICFLLGITAVDPLLSEVLFERFLSRERGEPPDIDVDFEHERREEVIQYIYERYGQERAAMVACVICFKSRGALRSTGKALGFSEEQIDAVISGCCDRESAYRSYHDVLTRVENSVLRPLLKDVSNDRIAAWATAAEMLHGFPRHLGVHSAGFVISQNPLNQICAIEPATMPGRFIIQWNKDDLEELGLFKIDLLALGMLTALRKTISYLKHGRKRIPGTLAPVELGTIPPDCCETYAMIQEAKTEGVFQIESRAQMSILPKIKPNCFYDLVISIGIVRPGPVVSGMVKAFTERRQGRATVSIPDERLRGILDRTLGVPIFQEQVMRIAMTIADFSPGEADELRRSMGKWKLNGDIRKLENRLRIGMARNGIPEDFAEVIYKQIESFSEYGFPESHATSFAHLAYASAWLKAHFPAEFLCGLLNSQPLGFYSSHTLIHEAIRAGVRVKAPHILRSGWDACMTSEGELQLGFRLISQLQVEHVDLFVEARERLEEFGGKLQLVDILTILKVFHSHEQIALAMANCFSCFDSNRRNILWKILSNPSALFDDSGERRFQPRVGLFEDWDNIKDDYRLMKTSLDNHPVALIKRLAWPFTVPVNKVVLAVDMSRCPVGGFVVVCGLVVVRQSPPTAKGMVFITLEDESGNMNLVISPQVWSRYRKQFMQGDLLCIYGKKEANGKHFSLMVKNAFDFSDKTISNSNVELKPSSSRHQPQESVL